MPRFPAMSHTPVNDSVQYKLFRLLPYCTKRYRRYDYHEYCLWECGRLGITRIPLLLQQNFIRLL